MATTIELLTRIAKLAKMNLSDINAKAYLLSLLNDAQFEINSVENWWWLDARTAIQTVVDKVAGTVSVTGATVTGSGTAFDSKDVGGYIQFTSTNDWYRIVSVADASTLTMEVPYVGATALAGASYIIRKATYALPADVSDILDIRQYTSPVKLSCVKYRTVDEYQPDMITTGDPVSYYKWFDRLSNTMHVGLYPIPDSIMNIEVRYIKTAPLLVNDSDTSIIPEKWAVTALFYRAAAKALDFNRDALADKYFKISEFFIEKMNEKEALETDRHSVIQNRDYGRKTTRIPFPSNYSERYTI